MARLYVGNEERKERKKNGNYLSINVNFWNFHFTRLQHSLRQDQSLSITTSTESNHGNSVTRTTNRNYTSTMFYKLIQFHTSSLFNADNVPVYRVFRRRKKKPTNNLKRSISGFSFTITQNRIHFDYSIYGRNCAVDLQSTILGKKKLKNTLNLMEAL